MKNKANITAAVAVWALSLALPAAANQRIQGWCEKGAVPVITSGLLSSTLVQASYPACTINVYITGSGGVAATIYSDGSGTPLSSPFQADQDGHYYFYAADGYYDIQLSGAGMASPYTLSGISNTSGGGSGGTGISSVGLAMPSGFSVYNSPLTSNGTLGVTLASQFSSYTLISPSAGGAPTWRRLIAADIPALGYQPIISGAPGVWPAALVTHATGSLTSSTIIIGNGTGDVKASTATIDSNGMVNAPGGFNSTSADSGVLVLSGATSGSFTQTVNAVAGNWILKWPAAAPTVNSQSLLVNASGAASWGGTIILYRCTVAGTLRVGQITTVSADCGTAVDTGLRVN